MNTISGGFFRQKPEIESVFKTNKPIILTNPREDENGNMFVCSNTGEIINFTDNVDDFQTYMACGGSPTCLAFNNQPDSTDIYISDVSNAYIIKRNVKNNPEQEEQNIDNQNDNLILPKLYESVPLKGPSSVIYSKNNNFLIFSDSGQFGQTSLNESNGSIFLFDLQLGLLRPLMLNCLAGPIDICYDDNSDILYVAEIFKNRILRLVQNPIGIFHCSVFHQFSGRFGPRALAIDSLGNIYVSRFEFQTTKGEKLDGMITVLNKEGTPVGELFVKGMSEINGMFISKNKKKSNYLYFTDRNFSGVQKIKLTLFSHELEKMQEGN